MANIYGVKFKDDGKAYYFKTEDFTCPLNVTVIVETEKGLQFGKVVKILEEDKKIDESEIKDIIRIATKNDYNQYLKNLKDATEAIDYAKECVEKLDLNMRLLDSSFTFDRKQLLFNFISDERIDFRELAKMLAGKYHTRIELRQVGARDKAKCIGGIGVCGKELCCKSFLRNMQSVTITMAKNQNIALNPNKINGSCGRLLCCLNFENEEYERCGKGMPLVGSKVTINGKEGVVVSIDILNRKYKVNIDNEVKEIDVEDYEGSKE